MACLARQFSSIFYWGIWEWNFKTEPRTRKRWAMGRMADIWGNEVSWLPPFCSLIRSQRLSGLAVFQQKRMAWSSIAQSVPTGKRTADGSCIKTDIEEWLSADRNEKSDWVVEDGEEPNSVTTWRHHRTAGSVASGVSNIQESENQYCNYPTQAYTDKALYYRSGCGTLSIPLLWDKILIPLLSQQTRCHRGIFLIFLNAATKPEGNQVRRREIHYLCLTNKDKK